MLELTWCCDWKMSWRMTRGSASGDPVRSMTPLKLRRIDKVVMLESRELGFPEKSMMTKSGRGNYQSLMLRAS